MYGENVQTSALRFATNILDLRFREGLLTEEDDIEGAQFIAEMATKITKS